MQIKHMMYGNNQKVDVYSTIFHVPVDRDKLYVILGKDINNISSYVNPMPNLVLKAAITAGRISASKNEKNPNGIEKIGILCKNKKSDTADFVRNYFRYGYDNFERAVQRRQLIILYDETGEFDDVACIKSNQIRLGDMNVPKNNVAIRQQPNPFGKSLIFDGCEHMIKKKRAKKISDYVEKLWCVPIISFFHVKMNDHFYSFAEQSLHGMSAGRIDVSISKDDWKNADEWFTQSEESNNPDGLYLDAALSIARSGLIELSENCSKKMKLLDELYEVKEIWDYALKSAKLPIGIDPLLGIEPTGIVELSEYLGIGAMLDARQNGVALEDIIA